LSSQQEGKKAQHNQTSKLSITVIYKV